MIEINSEIVYKNSNRVMECNKFCDWESIVDFDEPFTIKFSWIVRFEFALDRCDDNINW